MSNGYRLIYRKNKWATKSMGHPVWNAFFIHEDREPINWKILDDDSKFRTVEWFKEIEKFPSDRCGIGRTRAEALNSLQKQLAHKLIHSHRQDYIMLSIARNGK